MHNYDDICYECTGYGDDYYVNEDGNIVCACHECPIRKSMEEAKKWYMESFKKKQRSGKN